MTTTLLEQRLKEKIPISSLLKSIKEVVPDQGKTCLNLGIGRALETKPYKVGVLFSGGPAPGGNNVVAGLFDALMELNGRSRLLGFQGGASGVLEAKYKEIELEHLAQFRNLGGFHMLGTGRTKIETQDDFDKVASVVKSKEIDALVFVGGDDTNTNAAHLANYFKKHGILCTIVGIPKTIDGDLKGAEIETSFGFDTATKVYSEMIGNICIDACSSLKYWHFIKLMGRKASHVTLECALKTRPNLTFIGEEIEEKKTPLSEIIKQIADTIVDRANSSKQYGVCLLAEGLIEFIPEFKELISQLNRLLAKKASLDGLAPEQRKLFESLPDNIRIQLISDRDPHGNVQVSKIETEKLIYEMTAEELKRRGFKGKFNPQGHFFGYEGRCSLPSYFDAAYCYNLGRVAAVLINHRKSGYIASLRGLHKEVHEWRPIGVEIQSMLVNEERKGEIKQVIEKSIVKLSDPAFKSFKEKREAWRLHDAYLQPGPIQFEGPSKSVITETLRIEASLRSF